MNEAAEVLREREEKLTKELEPFLEKPHVIKAFQIMGQLMDVMSARAKLRYYGDHDQELRSEIMAKSKMADILIAQANKTK